MDDYSRMAEGGKVDQPKENKEGASTESDEDAERTEGSEKQKRIMAPRKKFEWDSEIRYISGCVARSIILFIINS